MVCNKELETKYILQMPDYQLNPDPRGMGCVYYDCMLKNKDRLAQVYGPTGEEDTYGQQLQRSVRTAIAMRNHGVKPGDYVSLCTFNHLDSATPIIASFFIGAAVAAVDPTLSLEDTIYLLKQTPPKIIFVLPEAVEMIEKVVKALPSATTIVVYGDTSKHVPFSDFLQPSDEEANFKPREVEDLHELAYVFFSSGTSGLPKGICLDHYAMLGSHTNAAGPNPPEDSNLTLAYSSPYWSVMGNSLGISIMSGTARLVFPKFDPATAWKVFDYKVVGIYFNTVQILTMLSQGRPKHVDISSVTDIVLGGGILKSEQMLKIREMFPETRVHGLYGLTELPSTVLMFHPKMPNHLEFMAKKPASTGSGLPGMAYKIVDPETEEILGPNQQGELRIKTKFQLSGYLNRDSSDIWDSDGWLKTGDVAYFDEDYCYYIVDRIKEMFKFQCWHIAPAVLESVLLTHPGIELAMVIGVPHDVDGDHPMGIVTLKQSHKNVTAQEIEKYVEERVQDRQRLRAGVKIVDSFPYLASGKIDRRNIKTMVLQGVL